MTINLKRSLYRQKKNLSDGLNTSSRFKGPHHHKDWWHMKQIRKMDKTATMCRIWNEGRHPCRMIAHRIKVNILGILRGATKLINLNTNILLILFFSVSICCFLNYVLYVLTVLVSAILAQLLYLSHVMDCTWKLTYSHILVKYISYLILEINVLCVDTN